MFSKSLFALLLVASSALAAPNDTSNTTSSTAPVLSCSITPADPPGPNEFQATQVTVRHSSGTLGTNKLVEIRLGSRPGGTLLGTVCTSDFNRLRTATTTVTLSPAITDPNYRWACTATQIRTACPPEEVPH